MVRRQFKAAKCEGIKKRRAAKLLEILLDCIAVASKHFTLFGADPSIHTEVCRIRASLLTDGLSV